MSITSSLHVLGLGDLLVQYFCDSWDLLLMAIPTGVTQFEYNIFKLCALVNSIILIFHQKLGEFHFYKNDFLIFYAS